MLPGHLINPSEEPNSAAQLEGLRFQLPVQPYLIFQKNQARLFSNQKIIKNHICMEQTLIHHQRLCFETFWKIFGSSSEHLQKLKMKKRTTASNSQVCKDGAKSKINYEMFFLFRPFLLIKTLSLEMLSLNSFQLKLFYRIV